MRLLRALVACAILAGAVGYALPALAQQGGAQSSEAEGPLIQNWWSWDYGPKAKDPAHRDWPPPFGFAFLNFAVFVGIMVKLCRKPLRGYLADRHERIRHDLDEAARLRAEAEKQLVEYERRVKDVDAEIEALLAGIQKEAEAEKARIIASAEEQARRLKADAERQIEAEIGRARLELRQATVEAAVAAASEILKRSIGGDDQRKMADRYVADLTSFAERAHNPRRPA